MGPIGDHVLVARRDGGHTARVKKTSLAAAKAHLSSLVDEAQHHRTRTLILRHGRPAAAIVPVEVAMEPRRQLSLVEIDALFAGLGSVAPTESAVQDLVSERR
jgi:prevent-host-death family protein